jgi:hypothetical protein
MEQSPSHINGVTALMVKFRVRMKARGPLPCSKKPATEPYPTLVEPLHPNRPSSISILFFPRGGFQTKILHTHTHSLTHSLHGARYYLKG